MATKSTRKTRTSGRTVRGAGTVVNADAIDVSERDFKRQVLELAGFYSWLTYWTWNSIHSPPGYPDLTLCRERVIFAELKSDTGRLRYDQKRWIGALRGAGAEVHVWRPKDLQEIANILSRREP